MRTLFRLAPKVSPFRCGRYAMVGPTPRDARPPLQSSTPPMVSAASSLATAQKVGTPRLMQNFLQFQNVANNPQRIWDAVRTQSVWDKVKAGERSAPSTQTTHTVPPTNALGIILPEILQGAGVSGPSTSRPPEAHPGSTGTGSQLPLMPQAGQFTMLLVPGILSWVRRWARRSD